MLADALGLLIHFSKLLVKLLLCFGDRRLRFSINALRL